MRELFPHLASRITFIPLGTDTVYFSPNDTPADGGVLTVGKAPDRDSSTLVSAAAASGLPCTIVTNRPEFVAPFQPLPGNITIRTASAQSLREEYGRARMSVLSLSTKSGRNDAVGCSTLDETTRRRLGEAARRYAVEQLDAERFAGTLARFFTSVIGS